MLFIFGFNLLYMYIHNCFQIMFKMRYMAIILCNFFLCCPLDTGFPLRENAVDELKILSGQRFFSQEMKKTLHQQFQTYTTEHQPEMVPYSAVRASPCIPPPSLVVTDWITQQDGLQGAWGPRNHIGKGQLSPLRIYHVAIFFLWK